MMGVYLWYRVELQPNDRREEAPSPMGAIIIVRGLRLPFPEQLLCRPFLLNMSLVNSLVTNNDVIS